MRQAWEQQRSDCHGYQRCALLQHDLEYSCQALSRSLYTIKHLLSLDRPGASKVGHMPLLLNMFEIQQQSLSLLSLLAAHTSRSLSLLTAVGTPPSRD